MFSSTRRRPVAALATAVAVIALFAGCGSNDHGGTHNATSSPSVDAAAGHNAADIAFARDMIPHHAQAIEMATLAETRAANPQVKSLAAAIKKAQDPEIAIMSQWLTDWKQPVPSASEHGGNHSMPGMMTQAQMTQLTAASGPAFDTLFLQMMIGHHQGAIEMAKTEQRDGKEGAVKALARRIEKDQAVEITHMRQLLQG